MNQLYWCPTCKCYVPIKLYSGGQESYMGCSICGSYVEHKKPEEETVSLKSEVFRLKKQGLHNIRIANELGISPTVVRHILMIPFDKDVDLGTNWHLDICDEFLTIGHQNLITNADLKEALDEN